MIDYRIHRWYLRTHPIARTFRAAWLMVAYAIFFAAIYMLGLYVTDRAALVTGLSASATDSLPVARGLMVAFGALSALLVLAPVVFSVWPRTRPPGWDPMPRQAPPARTETQRNGDAPTAKDVVKQPSTPNPKT